MADNDDSKTPPSKKPKKPANNSDLDPVIAKVIKDALMIQLVNANENRKRAANEIDAMVSTCQEFMKSFIILGYDMTGQPIQPIVFAHNQQEADALGSYMSKFIHHNIKEIDPSAE